jgi:hypothetical protein
MQPLQKEMHVVKIFPLPKKVSCYRQRGKIKKK